MSNSLASEVVRIKRQLDQVKKGQRLSHGAALENAVLEVKDDTGSLRTLLGPLGDGSVGVQAVNGPPPPEPSAPVVASVLGGVSAGWDGQFANGAILPMDWSRIEVHASQAAVFEPIPETLRSTIETAQGATVVVPTDDPVYVRLVARNTSGTASIPSATVGPVSRAPVVANDILDGIVTDVKLAVGAVTAAKLAVGAVDTDKLADNAVKIGKINAGAVTLNALGGPLSDTAAQRYVDAMSDTAAWTVLTKAAGATWTFLTGVTDAPTGQTVGQATGYTVARGNITIPYDPDVLYRISCRVRTTAASSSGPDSLYVGVLGVGADRVTLVNRTGANSYYTQAYPAASNASQAAAAGWVTYTGYVRGRAATGTTGTTPDPRTPGQVHTDVRFLSPLLYLNFGSGTSGATGTMQVDAFTIEALKTGVVDSTNLVVGSVTTAALATDAVTAGKVAADAISARELQVNSVTAAELSAGAVTATAILAGSVSTDKLVAGAIQTATIASGAVNADKVAAGAITTAKLDALAVTADKVAANAITADKILAGSITATALSATAIDGKTITGATIQTATSGERITLNEDDENMVLIYNAAGVAVGELSARGLGLVGTSGAAVVIAPDAVYPQLRWVSSTQTNYAAAQVIEPVAGDANLSIYCGQFAGSGYTDMSWRSYLGRDVAAIERVRALNPATVVGGRFLGGATYATIGYANTDAPATASTLTIESGVATLGQARFQAIAPASALSVLYGEAPTGHTGPMARLVRGSAEKFSVDKDGNTNVAGKLTAGNMAFGSVSITPSAAGVPTSAIINFAALPGTVFRGYVSAQTTVPGDRTPTGNAGVTGVSISDVTATSALVWVNRQNTTSTTVNWQVVSA